MARMKDIQFDEPAALSLEELAEKLGGEMDGLFIRCPSPRRPPEDRSCCVRANAARPDLFFIYYCEGPKSAAYAMVRATLGIGAVPINPKSAEAARRIWFETTSAIGTLAERCLRGRGIAMPVPPALRSHPSLYHDGSKDRWPGMVAGIFAPDGEPCAIHRTYLERDGSGKAPIDPARMTLGPIGGSAIRLCPVAEKLCIAEGIETALSVMQASGIGAWAALSANGLRAVRLPREVRHVIIAADGDEEGERAARAAARRFLAEGRVATIARPPNGKDFNDLLMAEVGP